ncbi:threonine synthase [Planctomycetaceae bacterium SCGC AG-212-D15]|nr:threonine synthase [Planctomycetaceae bacterium SCGC AG-212-D15]
MFVTHLESALDGTRLPAGEVHTVHQGRPLWVRYDLAAVKSAVKPADLIARPPSLWRYRELLPLPSNVEPVTLGEGMTPLLSCPRLGHALGLSNLLIKDESQLPTGSFKSRGMTTAVSMAKHFGLKRLAIPTAGNAGGALAAYAARAGLELFVFMPDDTPRINALEAHLAGARVFLVNGLITDCGRIVREGTAELGWFDMSTLKEPYRLEGKKTMGLELAEQLGWQLPDVILYPTGGGTGLIGMWKAFQELRELGWLRSDQLPRLISCQSEGCAPIVRAFESGQRFAEPFPDAHTLASGLRVPAAVGDFMMLDAIRASGGRAVAGREARIVEWMRRVAGLEGIAACPETAVCFDCLEQLRQTGTVGADESVVVFNTGAAQKYPEVVPLELPRLDKDRPVDYRALAAMTA